MFKPNYSICKECWNKRLIVVKAQLCQRCNEAHKALKKQVKRVVPPKKKNQSLEERLSQLNDINHLLHLKIKNKIKKMKPSGELEIFKQLWNERPHICQVSGEYIRRFDVSCFSHILPKSHYNLFRLNKDNIWIVTPEIHNEWHTQSLMGKKWDKKKEAREKLKQEYYKNQKP